MSRVDPADLTEGQLISLMGSVYDLNFVGMDKADILRYLRQHPSSRFEKLLTSANVVALVQQNRRELKQAKARAKKEKSPPRRIAGTAVQDPQYDIEVEFASRDGESFSNPIEVKSNTTYQVRMRLRQHAGQHNAIGFALDWKKSTSLSWADGHGTTTYEEAVSNPLVIARLVRTGSVSAGTQLSVRVVVAERYL